MIFHTSIVSFVFLFLKMRNLNRKLLSIKSSQRALHMKLEKVVQNQSQILNIFLKTLPSLRDIYEIDAIFPQPKKTGRIRGIWWNIKQWREFPPKDCKSTTAYLDVSKVFFYILAIRPSSIHTESENRQALLWPRCWQSRSSSRADSLRNEACSGAYLMGHCVISPTLRCQCSFFF